MYDKIKSFLRLTLFPFSDYKKIFYPAQWLEENKDSDEPPSEKKPKVDGKKVAQFWSVADNELSNPGKGL